MPDLRSRLGATWDRQAEEGFLLGSPGDAEARSRLDPATGVEFRFVWLPHRELRHNITALQDRGILDPGRDQSRLFHDPRDGGRHCFLCPGNVTAAHPRERMIDLTLGGRDFVAAVNFAWAAPHHFTVMTRVHTDQRYSERTLPEMLDLVAQSEHRATFHGAGVGATIPHHLHYQITSQPFPAEHLTEPAAYPIPVHRCDDPGAAHQVASAWINRDPEHHDVNLLVAGEPGETEILVFPRDRRRSHADNKGLIGCFEAAGYFVYSEPAMRTVFESADAATARAALEQIRPPAETR